MQHPTFSRCQVVFCPIMAPATGYLLPKQMKREAEPPWYYEHHYCRLECHQRRTPLIPIPQHTVSATCYEEFCDVHLKLEQANTYANKDTGYELHLPFQRLTSKFIANGCLWCPNNYKDDFNHKIIKPSPQRRTLLGFRHTIKIYSWVQFPHVTHFHILLLMLQILLSFRYKVLIIAHA